MPPGDASPPARRRRSPARRLLRIAAVLGLIAIALRVTGCMEHMFYHPARGPTPAPPGAEDVWFESADGTRLHGWFIPGAGLDPGTPGPAVLHVHGNAGNIDSHAFFTEHLPPAGFGVLIFDYRGYGRSEGRASRRGPLIADTAAALDALLARPDVDRARVGMYGQSLGGSIGLNVMAERPEIAAAVIESAFDSWRTVAANAVGGDPPHFVGRGLAALLIPDGHRPLDAVARIDRPLLILHGSADSIVPVSHGRRLAAAAPRAELHVIEGGDHNTLRQTHPVVDRLAIDFFRRHLAGGGD